MDTLDKYEVEESLIQDLPKIYEEKLLADKLAAAEALANNPQPVQQSSASGKEANQEDPSSMNPSSTAPKRHSNKPRQSAAGGTANKTSKKSASKSIGDTA